jgi:hypothetical protein
MKMSQKTTNTDTQKTTLDYVAPWVRVAIMLLGIGTIAFLLWLHTGSILPKNTRDAAIYQNALLLIVLGSSLLEYKFTKPVDASINSVMALITLLTVYGEVPRIYWWLIVAYCVSVLFTSLLCIVLSIGSMISDTKKKVANLTYRFSTRIGQARLLFSIVFLFCLFSFYAFYSAELRNLLLFWGLFIAIWPLRVPDLVTRLFSKTIRTEAVGELVRFDHPDIVRAAIDASDKWVPGSVRVLFQAGGSQRYVIPLYSQLEQSQVLGTGIATSMSNEELSAPVPGKLYRSTKYSSASATQVAQLLGADPTSKLIGFVVENSKIEAIKVETWDPQSCREGMLLWCKVGSVRVYYQIVSGSDQEEELGGHRHGYQIAEATQVGVVAGSDHFTKFTWLPPMNTPVFSEEAPFGSDLLTKRDGDFSYGIIPGTAIKISGPFVKSIPLHTVILGATGTGKTVLAHDMIRHAVAAGVKTICIDITSQYEQRLGDLSPSVLSLSDDLVRELGEKLFDAETGDFKAGKEKKVLRTFADRLRADIDAKLRTFLLGSGAIPNLALITLKEISNTMATLHITEMYLSTLFSLAKDPSNSLPSILVVVEEAHTVMPEASTMGLADYDSRGLVAKIAQIALQGRKYGIGLLVVAQRTATVSKSVLTQCNNMITFGCFDDTSLKFLDNIFDREHIALIPNLPRLHAVVHGPAFRSERPLVVEIPYDPEKDYDHLFESH